MQKCTTFFDYLKKTCDPKIAYGRLDTHSYRPNDYGNISNEARELIISAEENVTLFISDPLPRFLIYDSDKVIRAISEVSDFVNVKILLKRSEDSKEVDDLIKRLNDAGYQNKNGQIGVLDKSAIGNDRLREDYFIVTDSRNVFWKKSIYDIAEFIYDVPLLGEKLESQVGLLEAKYKDNVGYKNISGMSL